MEGSTKIAPNNWKEVSNFWRQNFYAYQMIGNYWLAKKANINVLVYIQIIYKLVFLFSNIHRYLY